MPKPSRASQKEALQKRMEQESTHYRRTGSLFKPNLSNVKFYKKRNGQNNIIDILTYESGLYDPVEPGGLAYVLRIFRHTEAGQNNEDIICIEQTFKNQKLREKLFGHGAFCPVCREYRARADKGATKDELKDLKYAAWPRTVYNIFDRYAPNDGGQVFETSAFLLQQYLDVISKRSVLPGETQTIENYIPYMDIEEGRSISFEAQGEAEKTKFIGIKFEDRRTPIPENVVNSVHKLDELIAWPTVASAYESFWGTPYEIIGETKNNIEEKSESDVPEPEQLRDKKYQEDKSVSEKPIEDDEEAILEKKLAEAKKRKAKLAELEKQEDNTMPNPCPSGYSFGKDIDEKAECGDCKVWKNCAKENDRLERESK